LNIWLINHYANPPEAPGDARHFSHARELISRGHTVRIVACSFLHLGDKHIPLHRDRSWQNIVCDGVPFTFIQARSYRGNSFGRLQNMLEFAFRVARRDWAQALAPPDLVLGSSPHPFAALAAQRVAAHYNVPFVLEIRDVWPYVLTEVGGHSRLHPFVFMVDRTMRYLYARAARIVMFSRHSAPLLEAYGADPAKILWIPHGVDLRMYPSPELPADDGVFTVTYLGAHNQWNSLDTILDAAKILQGIPTGPILLRFVGHGLSKAALIARARAEGIHNVCFDDPVPKSQVNEILRSSDAFVINNRVDGVSRNWMSFNKLYEYLAAGRPVIFGSCTPNDPVRESGAGLSVEAGNASELANAIAFLAAQPAEKLAEYGNRGRKHIEDNYGIAMLAARFESMAMEITHLRHGMASFSFPNPVAAAHAPASEGSKSC
jgi:glycosyltransferase involved in cell wall biosynthesis